MGWSRALQLKQEGLTHVARLIEAPLEAHPLALDAPWYAERAVAELPEATELLLVDGPPGYGDGMERSRYPALPVLEPRLSPGAMVILDDANRRGEREILERWAELGWRFGVRESEGVATGTRALA